MADIDDFLAEVDEISSVPHTPAQANKSVLQSADDELNELFGLDATPISVVPSSGETPEIRVEPSARDNEENEFLSWLDDSPRKDASPTRKSTASEAAAAKSSALSENTPKREILTSTAVDSFFDEVFGEESSSSLRQSPRKQETLSLSQQAAEIVSSSFPDAVQLRKVLLELGYVPKDLRGEVWCILLTGGASKDCEARLPGGGEDDLTNFQQLAADCEALASRRYSDESDALQDAEKTKQEMYDILVVYCLRRQVQYNQLYCNLLAPMVATSSPMTKSQALSCFYPFASEFAPLINLKHAALEMAVDIVHFWLRLLVSYHSPALAAHLDCVIPGWEQPISAISPSDVATAEAQHQTGSRLDGLDKELGLGVGNDDSLFGINSTWSSSPGEANKAATSSHHRPHDKQGCLPVHWICGFFTGSIPPEQSRLVLDWALLYGERYAGLFFIAALLELYSTSLMSMTGGQIRDWFRDVAMGTDGWFRKLRIEVDRNSAVVPDFLQDVPGEGCSMEKLSWASFVVGWIHAAATIRRTTPGALREALNDTDTWSESFLASLQSGILTQSRDMEEEVEEHRLIESRDGADPPESLLDRIRQLSKQLQQSDLFGSNVVESIGGRIYRPAALQLSPEDASRSEWYQNTKVESDTLCLWTDAAEAVPSICSNRRKVTLEKSNLVVTEFWKSVAFSVNSFQEEERSSESVDKQTIGVYLPRDCSDEQQPVYFGIDCRSEEERSLGLFPKAYLIDPSFVTDSDAISALLEILEPLASSVHLCIIGAGEEYVRFRNRNGNRKQYLRALREYNSRLNAIAMFFLKRSFRHVSILDGGFIAAARYLMRPETTLTISNSLVDVDMSSLNAILGIGMTSSPMRPVETQKNFGEQPGGGGISLSNVIPPAALNSMSAFISNNLRKLETKEGTIADELGASTKQLISGFGKRMSIFGDSLKKSSWVTGFTSGDAEAHNSVAPATVPSSKDQRTSTSYSTESLMPSGAAFTIDSEDDEEAVDERRMGGDSDSITISRTDQEKRHALAMHKIAGLRKGEVITISRESLPGAVLFPATKYKTTEVVVNPEPPVLPVSSSGSLPPPPTNLKVTEETQVHRFLVITKERFIVLDSKGGGVGSSAVIKSNHHLTELTKMTFRKKDPDLVTLFILSSSGGGEPRSRLYRVTKKDEFVAALQKNMQRFK